MILQLKLDTNGKLWSNNIYGQIFYVENDSLKLFFDASKLVKGQLAPYEISENNIRLLKKLKYQKRALLRRISRRKKAET